MQKSKVPYVHADVHKQRIGKADMIRLGIPLRAYVIRLGKDVIIYTMSGRSSVYRYDTVDLADQAHAENIDAYKLDTTASFYGRHSDLASAVASLIDRGVQPHDVYSIGEIAKTESYIYTRNNINSKV